MEKRIGVLLSGRGSNFEAFEDSVTAGRIPNAEIAVVISNREGAPGIQRAEARGIKTRVIPSKGLEREAYDRQVAAVLDELHVDLVCRLLLEKKKMIKNKKNFHCTSSIFMICLSSTPNQVNYYNRFTTRHI